MAVSQASYAKNIFNAHVGVGDKIIQSDATLVIDGYEDAALLIKNFPHPVLSTGEPIEIPLPMGLKMTQTGQLKINLEGPITMSETVKGHCFRLLRNLLMGGGEFTAKIYEGTLEQHLRYYPIHKCSMQIDPAERGFDDNSTVLDITGNISYHYFGEVVETEEGSARQAFIGQ